MLRPLLEELSEGQEIENARVFIYDSEGALMIIDEVVDGFNDVLLDLFSKVAVVVLGVEVEGVGDELRAEFEELELLDVAVVAVHDFLHFLVEGGVVAGQQLLVADVRVDQLRPKRFSIHRQLW